MRFFAYRLADHLGKTVAEIEAMGADEFIGWQEYEQLVGPLGCQRETLLNAHAVMVTAKVFGNSDVKLNDCLLFDCPVTSAQRKRGITDPQQQLMAWEGLAKLTSNSRIKEKRPNKKG